MTFAVDPTEPVNLRIGTALLPESLRFLGAIAEEQVDAVMRAEHEAPLEASIDLVEEGREEFRVGYETDDEGEAS